MALIVRDLFETQCGVMAVPQSHERFQRDFITALNRTLQQLNVRCNLTTEFAMIETLEDSVSSADPEDEYVVSAGLTWHLKRLGAMGTDRIDNDVAKVEWEQAINDYWTKQRHEIQSDSTADVTNLGYQE